MKVKILAKHNEMIEVVNAKTGKVLEKVKWSNYLTNKEWSQCRDGLIIYKIIKN